MDISSFYLVGLALAAVAVGGTLVIAYNHLKRLRKRFKHDLKLGKELSRLGQLAVELEQTLSQQKLHDRNVDDKIFRAIENQAHDKKLNAIRSAMIKIVRQMDSQAQSIKSLEARIQELEIENEQYLDSTFEKSA